MDIQNATQFASFISNSGLADLDNTFNQLVTCMWDYLRHCNCHKREDKTRIYARCNRLYEVGAKLASGRFANEFLAKTGDHRITCYNDAGQIIAIVSR